MTSFQTNHFVSVATSFSSIYSYLPPNFAEVSRYSNLLLKSIVLPKSFPKMPVTCKFPSTALKVMTNKVFSIVTTFQIWACHVMCV